MKINALTAATEAATLILSVDETVKNPQAEQEKGGAAAAMRGRAAAQAAVRGGRAGRVMRGRGGR